MTTNNLLTKIIFMLGELALSQTLGLNRQNLGATQTPETIIIDKTHECYIPNLLVGFLTRLSVTQGGVPAAEIAQQEKILELTRENQRLLELVARLTEELHKLKAIARVNRRTPDAGDRQIGVLGNPAHQTQVTG